MTPITLIYAGKFCKNKDLPVQRTLVNSLKIQHSTIPQTEMFNYL